MQSTDIALTQDQTDTLAVVLRKNFVRGEIALP
jgi:hypothetical protein